MSTETITAEGKNGDLATLVERLRTRKLNQPDDAPRLRHQAADRIDALETALRALRNACVEQGINFGPLIADADAALKQD
jgi:hypothetical protein